MNWKNIVNVERLEFIREGTLEHYHYDIAPAAHGSAMGAKKLGYNISIIPPGQFSAPYHFHHSEEELFLVLEGRAMLRQAGDYREIVKGDLIFFSTDASGAHQIHNHTDQPFKFLALSTNDELDVCEYPDSGKILVRKIKKSFKAGDAVDYWVGEENPKEFWLNDQ